MPHTYAHVNNNVTISKEVQLSVAIRGACGCQPDVNNSVAISKEVQVSVAIRGACGHGQPNVNNSVAISKEVQVSVAISGACTTWYGHDIPHLQQYNRKVHQARPA